MEFNIYSFDELTTQQLYDMMAHRFEVFVLGRGDIYRDFDYFDQQAKHLIATDENGRVQGYVRLLPSELHYDGYAENAFGRLSVKQEARCHGLVAVMGMLKDTAVPQVLHTLAPYLRNGLSGGLLCKAGFRAYL